MFSVRKEAGLFTFYHDEPDDPLQFETSREAFLYAIQNSVWDCFAVVLNDAAPESQQYQTHFVYNKDLAAYYGAAGQTVDQPSVFVALVPEKVTSK